MLKQGIRGARQWNDRYFVFTSNNTLAYYSQTNDDKPKFIYPISKDAGCELSKVYEEHRTIKSSQGGSSKETIYCIKLAWSIPVKRITDDAWEESSMTGGPEAFQQHYRRSSSPTVPPNSTGTLQARHFSYSPAPKSVNNSSQPSWHSERKLAVAEPYDLSGPPSPRQRQRPGADNDMTPQPSRTNESFSKSKGTSYRFRIKSTSSDDNDDNNNNNNHFLDLPNIDDRLGTPIPRSEEEDGPTSMVDEQKELHSLYLAKKKQNKKKAKKKVVDGAKLALAAGAFVGLGVLTAGASMAGLLILGAAAAAGGTGAAGAAANSTFRRGKKRETELIIASASYEEAKRWHAVLTACLQSESARESTWGQLFFQEGRSATRTMLPVDAAGGILTVRSRDGAHNSPRHGGSDGSDGNDQDPRDRFALRERATHTKTFVVPGVRWKPMEGGWLTFFGTGAQGLRIFKDEAVTQLAANRGMLRRILGGMLAESRPCPPLKAHILLNASPLNAFMCLMSYARMPDQANHVSPNSGQRVSFRVLETIDDHMDVIHVICRPLYLFPSYTSPRDFVVFRYWRFESDGSCVVCVESIEHPNCLPHPDFVRGEMHAAYTISPKKHKSGNRFVEATSEEECLLTAVVQVDPKGWVPLRPIPFLADQCYGEAFGISALLQLLDIRDAIDLDRFLPVGFETSNPSTQKLMKKSLLNGFAAVPSSLGVGVSSNNTVESEEDGNDDNCNYDFAFAGRESSVDDISMRFASFPTPYPVECWAEPDPNSFRVRGKTYKQDREKINAGPSIGRLVAVDILLADEAVYSGVSTHPNERIQLGLQREKALKEKGLPSDMPPFVFVVNIVLPGPPVYHGVFYFAVDNRSTIDGTDGSASSKLCSQFLFGDDDKFRDKTFKLIPQIVEGNFLVRKAVGSTPAIMGTKLKQLYVRSDRFFEVVLDCGSSSVASGVIRVVLPYSVHLTVDMGFLLEGNDESTLPERIFGCVRMKSVGFGPHLRRISRPV